MTKKLFFLTPSLHIGGAERWILELAKNLKRWEPVGVCLTQEFLHPDMAAAVREVMPIYHRGENIQADALVSWGIPTLASIVDGVKVPVVEVSHSDGSWDEQRACVYASCVGASHLAAVSQAAATAFPAILRDKVTVIPNGVDPARVEPIKGAEAWRESTGVGDRPIALFLGRFADVKNPLLAMAALQKLPADWVMVFVGHGPMEADIKAMAQKHFPERVMIVPPTQHVGDILAAANVMVVTSECEGHSLAINEAWLAGLPVVTTMFGWIQEMIEKHSGMVHVCSPDPASIADQIMLASQVSGTEATKAVALEHYTIDAMVERWEDYLDAITEPTKPFSREDVQKFFGPKKKKVGPAGGRLSQTHERPAFPTLLERPILKVGVFPYRFEGKHLEDHWITYLHHSSEARVAFAEDAREDVDVILTDFRRLEDWMIEGAIPLMIDTNIGGPRIFKEVQEAMTHAHVSHILHCGWRTQNFQREFIGLGFGALTRLEPLRNCRMNQEREVDVNFVGTVSYGNKTATAHRLAMLRATDVINFATSHVAEIKIRHKGEAMPMSLNQYFASLRSSKIALSPCGLARCCHRDFEAIMAGCVMVGPDRDDIETWPDIYRSGEMYVKCKDDYSDLREIVDDILANWDDWSPWRKANRDWLIEETQPSRVAMRIRRTFERCLDLTS